MKRDVKLKIFNPEGIKLTDNPYEFVPVEDEQSFQPIRLLSIAFTQLCYWVGCLFVGIYLGKIIVYFSGAVNVSFSPW